MCRRVAGYGVGVSQFHSECIGVDGRVCSNSDVAIVPVQMSHVAFEFENRTVLVDFYSGIIRDRIIAVEIVVAVCSALMTECEFPVGITVVVAPGQLDRLDFDGVRRIVGNRDGCLVFQCRKACR